jgi:microcystin degradation protein MlrC
LRNDRVTGGQVVNVAVIAVGGIQHETNVFGPYPATYEAFAARDEWPALCRGERMLEAVDGINLPVTGGIDRLRALGHQVVPLLWCSATPSAQVTKDAFERISAMFIETLASTPVDGVLLDLHGAMVCEHLADGDGELLRRIRACVGDAVPIAACLDLHANISDQMVAAASVLETYRSYPHVDLAASGARTADLLDLLLRQGLARFPACALRRTDFLIPPVFGCTLVEPARAIYARLGELVEAEVAGISLACGFPLADVPEAGPALLAYGFDTLAVERAADQLLGEIERREPDFKGRLYAVGEAVREAIRLSQGATGPVLLADSQDNPGGGGAGDTTGILRELLAQNAPQALVGVINDAAAAQAAHQAGVGASIRLSLGGRSGLADDAPLDADFQVLAISAGRFKATGPMLAGAEIEFGPTALLQVGTVKVAVGSRAIQVMDQSMFRHLGVDPAEQRIIALKSSVHFRNDFQHLASVVLSVIAPGPVTVDLTTVPFSDARLRRLSRKCVSNRFAK